MLCLVKDFKFKEGYDVSYRKDAHCTPKRSKGCQ